MAASEWVSTIKFTLQKVVHFEPFLCDHQWCILGDRGQLQTAITARKGREGESPGLAVWLLRCRPGSWHRRHEQADEAFAA